VVKYLGRRVEIAGTDLSAESTKLLQQMAAEVTAASRWGSLVHTS
jgi:hypothetical protein